MASISASLASARVTVVAPSRVSNQASCTRNLSVASSLQSAKSFGCSSSLREESEFVHGESSLFETIALSGDCEAGVVEMAVPKKHLSRTKTRVRRAIWKAQARKEALKALSLAKSVLTGRSKSFIYVQSGKKDKEEDDAEEASSE